MNVAHTSLCLCVSKGVCVSVCRYACCWVWCGDDGGGVVAGHYHTDTQFWRDFYFGDWCWNNCHDQTTVLLSFARKFTADFRNDKKEEREKKSVACVIFILVVCIWFRYFFQKFECTFLTRCIKYVFTIPSMY